MARASKEVSTEESTQSQQNLFVADLFPQIPDHVSCVTLHAPVALGTANLEQELTDHLNAAGGQLHFGVEADTVKLALRAAVSSDGAFLRLGGGGKAFR